MIRGFFFYEDQLLKDKLFNNVGEFKIYTEGAYFGAGEFAGECQGYWVCENDEPKIIYNSDSDVCDDEAVIVTIEAFYKHREK